MRDLDSLLLEIRARAKYVYKLEVNTKYITF